MSDISRVDRIIGVALVVLLMALLVLAVAHRSGPVHTATPLATRSTSATTLRSPVTGPTSTAPSSTASSTSPTASTAPPSSTATNGATTVTDPVPGPVSAVGDSIMLDIQPYLQVDIPGTQIDGLVSRQFEAGIAVVQADRAAGTLGNVLVVELGTNGAVTPSDFDDMMQAAAGVKRVVFVNINVPRSWEAPDNAVLAAGVARYPGVAVLADWNALSAGHPEWFTPDQVHLQPAGAQALAALVAQYA
jgi:hypothetical protein